ncbi:hypothetical protein MUK42_22272 [Musa troglodytarum]|uniref:Uncharacterized protein n=1 Tax=Musa troglodytarum TaxID=320322 RepID=A0A9E7G8J2_9LILI|nr:hypothetical protein MUK42_22272 [Musa troglodytarum]
MSVGDARCVALAGMNRPLKEGVGRSRRREEGSAWTYTLNSRSWPRKNRSQRGANERSELVRNINAILGGVAVRRRIPPPPPPPPPEEARVVRRKSARSSISSRSGMLGNVFGGRIRGAKTKSTGTETSRRNEITNGDEEIIVRSRSCSKFRHGTLIPESKGKEQRSNL